jgi:hypothetical protein
MKTRSFPAAFLAPMFLLPALLLGSPGPAHADEARSRGLVHRVLTYVPSRLFDVVDLVRARVRVGPGIAVGGRVTRAGDAYLGTYWTVYAGLPGPRGRVMPRLPVGLEARTGAAVSFADASTGLGTAPEYGVAEVGLGLQAALVGFEVGVEPWELIDLLAGFVLLDPAGDDF